jgi:aspartyl aminopeptidase
MLAGGDHILVDLEVNEIGGAVMDGFDAAVLEEVLVVAMGLGMPSNLAFSFANSGLLSAKPTTSTEPNRRKASTCAGPMKPVR